MRATPKYFQGANYRLRNTITRDGAAWNLAGGTVSVIWVTPGGTQMSALAATAQSGGGDGIYYYDVTTTFFDTTGLWQLTWKAVDASGNVGYDGPYAIPVKKIKTTTATKTPQSADEPYASPDDLINSRNKGDLGNWASETGDTLTPEQLLSDPITYFALLRGAGEIEMMAFAGKRYTPEDLQGLTGAAQAALIGLNCDLASYHLAKRIIPEPEKIAGYAPAQKMLEALRDGVLIFGLVEAAEAGLPGTVDVRYNSRGEVQRPTEKARRLFGNRFEQR